MLHLANGDLAIQFGMHYGTTGVACFTFHTISLSFFWHIDIQSYTLHERNKRCFSLQFLGLSMDIHTEKSPKTKTQELPRPNISYIFESRGFEDFNYDVRMSIGQVFVGQAEQARPKWLD